MVYKYLGYGVTDSNGVAKLDHDAEGQEIQHSYTGVGAGEIDVVASLDNPIVDGSIVSETFSVLDTLLYDTGTDATHNIWTGDTSNLTRGSEYSRLEESASPTPTSINTVMPTGLWVLTMSIKRDGHSTNWDINILNNNVSVFGCATPTNDVWTDITLVYDGSFIYYFENGSTTPTKKVSVMLDESKNTVLRLQTPQDITYIDFKDLIVLREGMSNISIGSSTPIIQSGSNATIKGTLYESSLPVKNATLDVYKNGTKVGTASTGDSGVASYTYSGTGAGATEFQFKYGNIVSEPCNVLDCIYYDDFSTDTNQRYYARTDVGNSIAVIDGELVWTLGTESKYVRLQTSRSQSTLNINDYKGKTITFKVDVKTSVLTTVSILHSNDGGTNYTTIKGDSTSTDATISVTGLIPSDITHVIFNLNTASDATGSVSIDNWEIYPSS